MIDDDKGRQLLRLTQDQSNAGLIIKCLAKGSEHTDGERFGKGSIAMNLCPGVCRNASVGSNRDMTRSIRNSSSIARLLIKRLAEINQCDRVRLRRRDYVRESASTQGICLTSRGLSEVPDDMSEIADG